MAPRGKSPAKPEGLTCAFCGKPQSQVARMISGYRDPTACICNECVERCAEILAEELDSPEGS